jgi:hypothetical protein
MNQLHTHVDPKLIDTLERRAARVTAVIDAVSQETNDRRMKEVCAMITDRILELVVEIREMREMDDLELRDRIDSLSLRLTLAERKIKTWPLPRSARRILSGRKAPAALAA